jgi:hypothetical protein
MVILEIHFKKMNMKKLLIILISVLSTGMLIAQDIKLDELLEKYFKTSGQDSLANIQTLKITGKMYQGGVEYLITAYEKIPDMERMEIDLQGTRLTSVVIGKAGWMINPFSGSSDPQDMSADMINNTRKAYGAEKNPYGSFNNPFTKWKENGNKIELVGREDMDGTPVYNLKMVFNDNDVVNYYMDTKKFMIIKLKEKSMIKGQLVDVEEIFSDFRDVDGFMVPHKLETYYNSSPAIVTTFYKIEINLPIDDAIFKKPFVNKK